jgi:hypothetical protein
VPRFPILREYGPGSASPYSAQKEAPARLAGKGEAKYLGCGKGEGSPIRYPRNQARGGTVPANAHIAGGWFELAEQLDALER